MSIYGAGDADLKPYVKQAREVYMEFGLGSGMSNVIDNVEAADNGDDDDDYGQVITEERDDDDDVDNDQPQHDDDRQLYLRKDHKSDPDDDDGEDTYDIALTSATQSSSQPTLVLHSQSQDNDTYISSHVQPLSPLVTGSTASDGTIVSSSSSTGLSTAVNGMSLQYQSSSQAALAAVAVASERAGVPLTSTLIASSTPTSITSPQHIRSTVQSVNDTQRSSTTPQSTRLQSPSTSTQAKQHQLQSIRIIKTKRRADAEPSPSPKSTTIPDTPLTKQRRTTYDNINELTATATLRQQSTQDMISMMMLQMQQDRQWQQQVYQQQMQEARLRQEREDRYQERQDQRHHDFMAMMMMMFNQQSVRYQQPTQQQYQPYPMPPFGSMPTVTADQPYQTQHTNQQYASSSSVSRTNDHPTTPPTQDHM